MTKTAPRYIKAESLSIGDTIRVTWTEADVAKSITGKLAVRDVRQNFTEFLTAAGTVLFARTAVMQAVDAEYGLYKVRITLLDSIAVQSQVELWTGIDEISKITKSITYGGRSA